MSSAKGSVTCDVGVAGCNAIVDKKCKDAGDQTFTYFTGGARTALCQGVKCRKCCKLNCDGKSQYYTEGSKCGNYAYKNGLNFDSKNVNPSDAPYGFISYSPCGQPPACGGVFPECCSQTNFCPSGYEYEGTCNKHECDAYLPTNLQNTVTGDHVICTRDWSKLDAKNKDACCTGKKQYNSQFIECSPSLCPQGDRCLNIMIDYISPDPKELFKPNTQSIIEDYLDTTNIEYIDTRRQFLGTLLRNKNNITQLKKPDQEFLVKWCQQYPGICDGTLKRECANFTREGLAKFDKQPIADLCGCFMNDREYAKYKYSAAIETPQCDPMCFAKKVQPGEQTSLGWKQKVCDQNVCVIDGVNIDINKAVGGGINFTNMCGSDHIGECTFSTQNQNTDTLNDLQQNIGKIKAGCKKCQVIVREGTKTVECTDVVEHLKDELKREAGENPPPPSSGDNGNTFRWAILAVLAIFIVGIMYILFSNSQII